MADYIRDHLKKSEDWLYPESRIHFHVFLKFVQVTSLAGLAVGVFKHFRNTATSNFLKTASNSTKTGIKYGIILGGITNAFYTFKEPHNAMADRSKKLRTNFSQTVDVPVIASTMVLGWLLKPKFLSSAQALSLSLPIGSVLYMLFNMSGPVYETVEDNYWTWKNELVVD
eukprot:TRINITY_DN11444_c0_g1_i1.p1 TRINITY_DN11444_c0_g1~~TRINITY_DN11444_c0_g1_i1.p1  ORF type:complete len:170 (+),score=21.42 TRINITY_DN11444_c0_g1_i1:27-536(+)